MESECTDYKFGEYIGSMSIPGLKDKVDIKLKGRILKLWCEHDKCYHVYTMEYQGDESEDGSKRTDVWTP